MKKSVFVRFLLICLFVFFGMITMNNQEKVAAAESWGYKKTGMKYFLEKVEDEENEEVVVAVVDTGIDPTHKWFEGRLKSEGRECFGSGCKPWKYNDNDGHGTHVAGIITKITPSNVKILPIKIFKEGEADNFLAAMEYIIELKKKGMNIKVVNCSFGGYDYKLNTDWVKEEIEIIKKAYGMGILVVAGAGNDNKKSNTFGPANLNHVIAVSALNKTMNKAWYSNYGDYVVFAAPGSDIASAKTNALFKNRTILKSGTSMATPHVVADIALLYTVCPKCSNQQIEKVLKDSAVDIGKKGKDEKYGYGYIDMERAYDLIWDMANPLAKVLAVGKGRILLSNSFTHPKYLKSQQASFVAGNFEFYEGLVKKYTLIPENNYYISKVTVNGKAISSAQLEKIVKNGYILISPCLRNTIICVYFSRSESIQAGGSSIGIINNRRTNLVQTNLWD